MLRIRWEQFQEIYDSKLEESKRLNKLEKKELSNIFFKDKTITPEKPSIVNNEYHQILIDISKSTQTSKSHLVNFCRKNLGLEGITSDNINYETIFEKFKININNLITQKYSGYDTDEIAYIICNLLFNPDLYLGNNILVILKNITKLKLNDIISEFIIQSNGQLIDIFELSIISDRIILKFKYYLNAYFKCENKDCIIEKIGIAETVIEIPYDVKLKDFYHKIHISNMINVSSNLEVKNVNLNIDLKKAYIEKLSQDEQIVYPYKPICVFYLDHSQKNNVTNLTFSNNVYKKNTTFSYPINSQVIKFRFGEQENSIQTTDSHEVRLTCHYVVQNYTKIANNDLFLYTVAAREPRLKIALNAQANQGLINYIEKKIGNIAKYDAAEQCLSIAIPTTYIRFSLCSFDHFISETPIDIFNSSNELFAIDNTKEHQHILLIDLQKIAEYYCKQAEFETTELYPSIVLKNENSEEQKNISNVTNATENSNNNGVQKKIADTFESICKNELEKDKQSLIEISIEEMKRLLNNNVLKASFPKFFKDSHTNKKLETLKNLIEELEEPLSNDVIKNLEEKSNNKIFETFEDDYSKNNFSIIAIISRISIYIKKKLGIKPKSSQFISNFKEKLQNLKIKFETLLPTHHSDNPNKTEIKPIDIEDIGLIQNQSESTKAESKTKIVFRPNTFSTIEHIRILKFSLTNINTTAFNYVQRNLSATTSPFRANQIDRSYTELAKRLSKSKDNNNPYFLSFNEKRDENNFIKNCEKLFNFSPEKYRPDHSVGDIYTQIFDFFYKKICENKYYTEIKANESQELVYIIMFILFETNLNFYASKNLTAIFSNHEIQFRIDIYGDGDYYFEYQPDRIIIKLNQPLIIKNTENENNKIGNSITYIEIPINARLENLIDCLNIYSYLEIPTINALENLSFSAEEYFFDSKKRKSFYLPQSKPNELNKFVNYARSNTNIPLFSINNKSKEISNSNRNTYTIPLIDKSTNILRKFLNPPEDTNTPANLLSSTQNQFYINAVCSKFLNHCAYIKNGNLLYFYREQNFFIEIIIENDKNAFESLSTYLTINKIEYNIPTSFKQPIPTSTCIYKLNIPISGSRIEFGLFNLNCQLITRHMESSADFLDYIFKNPNEILGENDVPEFNLKQFFIILKNKSLHQILLPDISIIPEPLKPYLDQNTFTSFIKEIENLNEVKAHLGTPKTPSKSRRNTFRFIDDKLPPPSHADQTFQKTGAPVRPLSSPRSTKS